MGFTRAYQFNRSISLGLVLPTDQFHSPFAIATREFHWTLHLLLDYFTGSCTFYRAISLVLAIATGVFHWALQLLLDYFTGSYSCYRAISLDLAIATGVFHWALHSGT